MNNQLNISSDEASIYAVIRRMDGKIYNLTTDAFVTISSPIAEACKFALELASNLHYYKWAFPELVSANYYIEFYTTSLLVSRLIDYDGTSVTPVVVTPTEISYNGEATYAHLRNHRGEIFNLTTSAFEVFTSATDDHKFELDYADGVSTYSETWPILDEDIYIVQYYDGAGYLGYGLINYDGSQSVELTSYATVAEADTYLNNRLNGLIWRNTSTADKKRSLNIARQAIDNLNFKGGKYDVDQDYQFPRDENGVPDDIVKANIEEALTRLQVDRETAKSETRIKSMSYAGISYTFDTSIDESALGILSTEAQDLLTPFLRSSSQIKLVRID